MKRLIALLATALPAAATAATQAEVVDHIILGVADLDRGIADLEARTGVKLTRGGSHPGGGTRNALMSLGGDTYLELLAPDPAQTVNDPGVDELKALAVPTPAGWAVRTNDIAGLTARLTAAGIAVTPPIPGARTKPDGSRLEWTIIGLSALKHPLAPFFIAWKSMATHPSRTSPGGCRLAGLSIDGPDLAPLRPVVAALALPIALHTASTAHFNVTLDCPRGRVRL